MLDLGKRAQARGVWFGQRQEALTRRANGEALVEIASSYAVSHSTISRLQARTINDLLSKRAYSSSKRLIVRHKVIQQREQFCSPLDDLAFQVTFLDQFDLPVG